MRMNDEKDNLTIGKKLHDARVAKGYTLDDLQKNTKIQKRYLIAIEDNDFDSLPGEFYVRAFVKQYADSVGLNGNELLSRFDTKLPDTEDPEYVNRVNSDNPKTRSAQRQVDQRNEKIRRYIPVASVSVVVLVILIAIWVAAAHSTRDTSKTQIETSKVSVSGNKSSKASSSSSSSAAKKNTKKKDATKKLVFKKLTESGSNVTYQVTGASSKPKIKIATTGSGSAWTSVSANGSTLWQAAQAGGKSHTVTLPSSVSTATINTGNAPQTVIYVSGKQLKLSDPSDGSSNQVRVVTLQFGKSGSTTSTSSSSTTDSSTTGTTGSSTTGSTEGTSSTTGTTGTNDTTGNTTTGTTTGSTTGY